MLRNDERVSTAGRDDVPKNIQEIAEKLGAPAINALSI
jgi:hypothetical protein